MKLSLLLKIALLAAKRFAPGIAEIPALAADLIRDLRSHLPEITHDDGTPIPLSELDAMVDAKALAAHAAVHLGDPPPSAGDEQPPAAGG